jgi:hypothetical protein
MKQFKFSTLSAFRIAMMLALGGVASIGYAQTITTFDVANSNDTQVGGLNSFGQVTGDYVTADRAVHGFLREPDGTIATFDVPGAAISSNLGTFPRAINPTGQIIGYYDDTTTQSGGCNGHCLTRHAFLRQRNGTFITFDAPGAGSGNGQGTFPESITPSVEISGEYIDMNGHLHGFLRQPDGTIVTFDGVTNASLTAAVSINPEGKITGYSRQQLFLEHGFLRDVDGTITIFDVCTAASAQSLNCNPLPNGQGVTQPVGINSAGLITGAFVTFDGARTHAHGFLRQPDGAIITFDANGSSSESIPTGINSAGEITGGYQDVTNNVVHHHGFLRQPDGTIVTFDIPGGDTYPGRINSAGEITGDFQDVSPSGTAGHLQGFARTPPAM